jgi:hypothetical protein
MQILLSGYAPGFSPESPEIHVSRQKDPLWKMPYEVLDKKWFHEAFKEAAWRWEVFWWSLRESLSEQGSIGGTLVGHLEELFWAQLKMNRSFFGIFLFLTSRGVSGDQGFDSPY